MDKSELNVLIVEDDASQRTSLVEAVKRCGYRAVPVGSPEETESIVKIKPIHGIIADCMLPGKSGVDLVVSLKRNLIDGCGIILISGIYKDKTYAQEATKKTGAKNFYHKPFNIDHLMSDLEEILIKFQNIPKLNLHAFLSAESTSSRDRLKSLETVDSICGYDLPFIFGVIMNAKFSGYLNIVDSEQNIYGVSFYKGGLLKIDGESVFELSKELLLSHGFITKKDLSAADIKKKGDLVKLLIDAGLISPHAGEEIRKEIVTSELKKVVTSKNININLAPDRKMIPEYSPVYLSEFMTQIYEIIHKMVPHSYLKAFYKIWETYPLCLTIGREEDTNLLNILALQSFKKMIDQSGDDAKIEKILSKKEFDESVFYSALHLLCITRVVYFNDHVIGKKLEEHEARLRSIYEAVKEKNPIQIFQYFGLGDNPKAPDVARVYKEFAKSNHPDLLPDSAKEDVKKINHQLLSMVSEAYEVLTDEKKRKLFMDSLKQEDVQKLLETEGLIAEAASLMERGMYSEALPIVEKARIIHPSLRGDLHYVWAKIATSNRLKPSEETYFEEVLNLVPNPDRKNALYTFVSGLLKRSKGNVEGAYNDFKKSLQYDAGFIEARREITKIKNQIKSMRQSNETITSELTSIISNFFGGKKKSG